VPAMDGPVTRDEHVHRDETARTGPPGPQRVEFRAGSLIYYAAVLVSPTA
jgi:hypothetical protein